MSGRSPIVVTVAVEGPTDVPVVKRLLHTLGLQAGPIHDKGGKGGLDTRLRSYNQAARFSPWLVLRDLDHDEMCAGQLVGRLLPAPSEYMRFRVAVRETEAWLIADRIRLAEWLCIPPDVVPNDPDALDDPKRALIDLARTSRKRSIREDMTPMEGTTARVGPGYLARIVEYTRDYWQPERAAESSKSLARCMAALARF